jgi:hypothetical protein
MLFEQIKRNFKGPRGHVKPYFDYLNYSARASSERIRQLLEDWFFHYPSEAQSELRIRFRSSDDIEHRSAFFELYLHELLLKLGYSVDIHPDIPGKRTHPEFLVSLKGKPLFYLEAILASGPKEEVAAEKRENMVYETIDKMNSPNFFIGVKVHGTPNTSPPGKKWSVFLEKRLSELDPDAVGELLKSRGLESLPNWTLNHDGWDVTFQAIPKSPKARGKPGVRPIGVRFFGLVECKEDEYIRNAIKEKATKYGSLDLPYIIAIDVVSDFFDDNMMVLDALFGDDQITIFYLPEGGPRQEPTRAPNGAFRGPQGPQNTRVSGVIICGDLLWGNISKTNPILWHNPWASIPFKQDLWPLPQWVLSSDKTKIEPKQGRNIGEILDLPYDWPVLNNKNDLE